MKKLILLSLFSISFSALSVVDHPVAPVGRFVFINSGNPGLGGNHILDTTTGKLWKERCVKFKKGSVLVCEYLSYVVQDIEDLTISREDIVKKADAMIEKDQ